MKHFSPSSFRRQDVVKTTGQPGKPHRPVSILDKISLPKRQPGPCDGSGPPTEEQLRLMLRARRNRVQFFDADLFADPAWDILLELYAAKLGQQKISVSSLCIGAAVPATTALRWIGTLEKKGLLVRTADPYDGRRVFVSLSEAGGTSMAAYFQQPWGTLAC